MKSWLFPSGNKTLSSQRKHITLIQLPFHSAQSTTKTSIFTLAHHTAAVPFTRISLAKMKSKPSQGIQHSYVLLATRAVSTVTCLALLLFGSLYVEAQQGSDTSQCSSHFDCKEKGGLKSSVWKTKKQELEQQWGHGTCRNCSAFNSDSRRMRAFQTRPVWTD